MGGACQGREGSRLGSCESRRTDRGHRCDSQTVWDFFLCSLGSGDEAWCTRRGDLRYLGVG